MTPLRHVIEVSQSDLDDLRPRLRLTRWPVPWPGAGWQAGTDAGELRRLVELWVPAVLAFSGKNG
jgi:hypothetical protein